MADDIARVGVAFDTTDIERGNAALDTLANKGEKVESSLGKVEKSAASAGKSIGNLGGASSGGIAAASAASERAAGSMDKLGQASQRAGRDLSGAADSVKGLGAQVSSLDGFVKGAIGALSVGAVIQLGRAFLSVADDVTTLRTRLALSSQSVAEAGAAYNGLLSIAQRARVSFTELGGTYAQIARSTQELGLSQDRLLRVTETIAKSMTISGGSAASMQAALTQLSQGFASGTLRGEELNSILEQTPRLAQAIADGLGVPIGKLREMGQAGQLSAEQVIGALERTSATIDAEFSRTATTVSQAITVLGNSMSNFVGILNESSGASSGAAGALLGLASAVDAYGAAMQRNREFYDKNPELGGFFYNARRLISSDFRASEDARLLAQEVGPNEAVLAAKAAEFNRIQQEAKKAAEAVNSFATATGNLTRQEQKQGAQTKLLQGFAGAVKGLAQDSDQYLRAYRALQTGIDNIETQYAARKTAGTKATDDRAAALKREMEAQESLNAVIAQAIQRDDDRAAKDAADARKAIEEDLAKRIEAQKKLNETLADEVQSLRETSEERGLSVDAVDRLRVARLNEASAMQIEDLQRRALSAGSEAERLSIEQTITSLRELIELRGQDVEGKVADRAADGASRAADRAADQWARTADQIGQSLSDALMDGGKSASEYIEGLFRSMVLQPMIQGLVVNPITQGIGQAFGGAGASSSGGMGGMGGVPGMGNMAGSAALWAGSALGTGTALGGFATGIGTALSSGAGTAATWAAGSSLAGTAGGAAAGAGMMAGAAIPYVAAAIALYSLLSSGGERRAGSTYGYSASALDYGQGLQGIWSDEVAGRIGAGQTRFIGGPSGGEIGGDVVRESVAATVGGINDLFERLGSPDRIDQFWGKLEQSEKGRGGVFAGGALTSGASFGEASWESGTSRTLTTEEATSAFALDLQQSVVQALQAATDIPASISDLLSGIDAEALTQEQVGALLQSVESIVSVTAAMSALGVQADAVTTAMLAAAGGADTLSSAAASYYQGYYSESERVGALSEQLAGQIGALGLEMPGTRDEFRALVESLDLTTAQGQSAYGTLLTLSDAFGVVADSAASAADESLRAAQESARAAQESARAALDAQSAAIEDEIAAMVRAFGDLEGAMSALDAPAENIVEQWQSASQQLADMTRELDRILGTGEAGPFDALAQTVASLASASRGIEAIDQMRFGVATSAASDQSVELMAQRERELFAELRTAADPAAVAQELAQVALARIKMAGDLSGQVLADEYREQYESARAVLDLQRESRDEQISALREQISAAEQMRRIIGGMRGVIDDLLVGDLSALGPEGRLGAARQSYDRTLAGARAGDVSAMSEYADALRTYLGQSQSYYGGATSEYASAFAAALAEAEGLAGTQVSDIELLSSQLETLQSMDIEQAEMRRTVIDTSAEQLAALDSIGAALRERESALQQRQDEQASAARQQVDLLSAIVEGQEAEIRQRAAAMQALQEQLAKLQDQIGRIQSSVESIEVAA
ncbi:MAG: tape measure protein [Candidatus Kapaibacterium sp.]